MKKSASINYSKTLNSTYKHKLVAFQDKLLTKQFIVLKNEFRDIIAITDFHKYIHSSNKRGSKSIYSNGGNRFKFVAQFLNYVLIDIYNDYGISKISEISLFMVQDFFIFYGLDEDNLRQEATVDICTTAVVDFLVNFIRANPRLSKMQIDDLTYEDTYWTPQGRLKTRLVPVFETFYLEVSKVESSEIFQTLHLTLSVHMLKHTIKTYIL